jgi:hypothetical protein
MIVAMDHSATLHDLPETFQFPPELRERIRFDTRRKRLVFSGFMTKSEYDQLFQLHGEVGYQRAIERLFQLSSEQEIPQFRRVLRVLGVLVVLCLMLGAVVWWELLRTPRLSGINDRSTSRAEPNGEKGVLHAAGPANRAGPD